MTPSTGIGKRTWGHRLSDSALETLASGASLGAGWSLIHCQIVKDVPRPVPAGHYDLLGKWKDHGAWPTCVGSYLSSGTV